MAERTRQVTLRINGTTHTIDVPPRRLLSDALRHDLRLTGTHVGCEHGVCGCCTVLLDGSPVRSCLVFAVSVGGHEVTTIEGLSPDGAGDHGPDHRLHPVQRAFQDCHGLQCGFCTPGFVMTVTAMLDDNPDPSHDEIVDGVSGNLCRCTGYTNIIAAVERAAELLREDDGGAVPRADGGPIVPHEAPTEVAAGGPFAPAAHGVPGDAVDDAGGRGDEGEGEGERQRAGGRGDDDR